MKKELRTDFKNRQYMIHKDFEIYYYSDRNFSDVHAHTHDYYEFYIFSGGDVSLHVNDSHWHLTPGDLIIIPPDTRHFLTVHDHSMSYQRFIFWISQSFYHTLLDQSSDYAYVFKHVFQTCKYIYHLDLFSFNDLQSKVIQLIEEIHTNRFCKDEKINLCVRDLILSINRNIYELENPNREKEEKTLYQNIVDYIEQHIHEALSLNTLSEQFYVSKYHISHVFKAQIGLSVHQYILKKRLYICKSALLQGTNISTAYLQCGFNDYSSFFKAFKKEFGLSPKEYVLNYSVSSNQNITCLEGLGTTSDVCVSHNNIFIDNSSNKD